MFKNYHNIVFGVGLFCSACLLVHAAPSKTIGSFEQEFEWVDIRTCKIPPIKPPAPIQISSPIWANESKNIYIRRWLDKDGDGLCEGYDIDEMEKSAFTGKIYGYPIRTVEFQNGRWKISGGVVGSWFPLILLDKVTGERIDVNYAYGNAGYSAAAREAPSDCANLRAYLAEGYMLNFHFPKFARNDPVTDPEGDWNDVISGWFFSQYTYKEAVIHSALPTECIEKYQAVIDALAKKLEH